MAVAIACDLDKDMAGSPLLRGVSFKLERRDRMTLRGATDRARRPCCGYLAARPAIDGGKLSLQKGAKVTLHDQRPPLERDVTLREYVLSGAAEVVAMEAELARLEQAMADGDAGDAHARRYRRTQERFELRGGYRWRDQALVTIRGLGFDDDELDRRLDTFSGGELTRASLARALTGEPDLLLLDEPTNHLDIASLEWLEEHLTSLDAAIVLVAHDRWFLEAVGTSVLELEAGRSRFFPGTWTAWRKEQAMRELRWARRSRSSRPRSPGWSASWSGSGPRPQRRARPSRASSAWRRWTGSSAIRVTSARCRSRSSSPSARGGWCSTSPAGGSRCPAGC